MMVSITWLTVDPTLWSLALSGKANVMHQLHVHQRIVSYLNSAVPLVTNTHSVTHPPPKPQSQPAWCNTYFTLTGIRAPYLDVFTSSALLLIHAHPLLLCVQPSLNDEAHKAISSKQGI